MSDVGCGNPLTVHHLKPRLHGPSVRRGGETGDVGATPLYLLMNVQPILGNRQIISQPAPHRQNTLERPVSSRRSRRVIPLIPR
ncbi:hypothetical protein EYF80_004613 [Liparis tanakae]|uniref:Uncharacterized protein n=1 Tax=Liparis tanakae TaxID=230148 RepID=A0A4Z2J6S6_9TELE|nr:hypothetical protein EYF80_004613 [Liparis tanakae]